MELKDLYEKFIQEGYTDFYIEGLGGPKSDDVHCLGFENQYWIVYYIERGQSQILSFQRKTKKSQSDTIRTLYLKLCIGT